ncbi:hypothetical protein [Rhizobium sp. BK176]|uniref:hypothetical protein n=1 Tax=Rhizobium sp. BK176 TaxID=2587071 RepID=UPI002167E31E|nr:hypothetical protein [Rhizobium sp. BK176]MCS4090022.1 hypothetical protein [Rhizobium sp. BK176]
MTAKFTRSGKVILDEENGEFADAGNPFEILSWMDSHAEFEDGITFRELLDCLAPWSVVIDAMLGMDFNSWKAAAGLPAPPVSDDPRERIVRIEVKPSLLVDRDDETLVANVSIEWDVSGVLEQPDEADGRTFEVTGISLRHPSEYANLPLVFVSSAEVSDIMTIGVTPPFNSEPAIHPTADGQVKGFAVSTTVLSAVLYGFLGDLASTGSPEDRAEKIETIVGKIEEIRAASAG